jgi:sigma-B regulation protein RsbU (phosphoserine phosphatase)
VTYDQVTYQLTQDDVFVFCTDGVFEAMNGKGLEFGSRNLIDVVHANRAQSAREIVDAIFEAVRVFRGDAPQNDDMTAVAVKITG